METIVRILHIAAGAVALFSGITALLLSTKTRKHRPVGKVFAYAMTGVFITAIYLAIVNSIDFLLSIAVLSYFSVVSGIRALKFLKGATPKWYDWLSVAALAGFGFFLAGKGTLAAFNQFTAGVVLYLFFGIGMLFYAFITASEFIRNKPRDSKWFIMHQSNMGAALIATITAFCTTAMPWLPSISEWILPTVILSPLLTIYIRRYKKLQLTSAL